MIATGETNEYAAEVAFFLPTVADPTVGLTGHAFVLGEVVRRLPADVAFSNAPVIKLIEVGHGWYVERFPVTDLGTPGNIYLRADVTGAQPAVVVDTIGVLGGSIPQNGDGVIGFYAANASDPVFGSPVSSHDFTLDPEYNAGSGTTSLVQLRLPNGSFANAKVASIVSLGNGAWGLALTAAAGQTALKGKAFIYAAVPGAKVFTGYVDILGSGVSSGSSTTTTLGPIAFAYTPVPNPSSSRLDHAEGALARLCQMFREKLI